MDGNLMEISVWSALRADTYFYAVLYIADCIYTNARYLS